MAHPLLRLTLPRLTQQQIRFLDAYAISGNGTQAAITAGYTKRSAPQMAQRTLKNPRAVEYLKGLRSESRAIVAYDLSMAMRESIEVIEFAKEKGNAMAYFKAVEHRAKLSGLLVDRVEVATVDLTAALDEARKRWQERHGKVPKLLSGDDNPQASIESKQPENGQSTTDSTTCELT